MRIWQYIKKYPGDAFIWMVVLGGFAVCFGIAVYELLGEIVYGY